MCVCVCGEERGIKVGHIDLHECCIIEIVTNYVCVCVEKNGALREQHILICAELLSWSIYSTEMGN